MDRSLHRERDSRHRNSGSQEITVFTGDSIQTLSEVAAGVEPYRIPAVFQAIAGNTYQISVFSLLPGNFILHLNADLVFPHASQPTPAVQVVRKGDSAQFKVIASGEPPLSYQWRLNGIALPNSTSDIIPWQANGINPPESTGDTLSFSHVDLNWNGVYSVEVRDANQNVVVSSNATLVVLIPPRNEAFDRATVLSGTDTHVTGSSIGTVSQSVWWVWTAPYDGETIISGTGSDLIISLGVFTGDSIPSLKRVVNGWGNATFRASGGTKYRIGVFATRYPTDYPGGTFQLHLLQNRPEAPRISTQAISRSVDLGASTAFAVTATGRGPLLYQWRHNGKKIPGAVQSKVTFPQVSDSNLGNYDVLVSDAFGTARSLAARLALRSAPPVNDDFEQATVLSGVKVRTEGKLGNATLQTGEPLNRPSVWWNWIAPEDGEVILTSYEVLFGCQLAVYTGEDVASLTEISSRMEPAADPYYKPLALTFHAQAKTLYHICVAAFQGDHFTLDLVQNNADRAPTFFSYFEDEVAFVGDNIAWPVQVFGREPIRYQWQFNGVNLRNQTNATLTIDGVKPAHAGRYRLVARNAVGVAATRSARLSVFSPTKTTATRAR